jgi:hypothetical protein
VGDVLAAGHPAAGAAGGRRASRRAHPRRDPDGRAPGRGPEAGRRPRDVARRADVAGGGAALARLDGPGGAGAGPVPLGHLPAAARRARGRAVARRAHGRVGRPGCARGDRAARRAGDPPVPAAADRRGADRRTARVRARSPRPMGGGRPTGLWPPELGYRPRGRVADATAAPLRVDRQGTPTLPRLPGELPGLEELYAAQGIDHVLVDAPTLVRAAGGRERDWTVRPVSPDPRRGSARRGRPRRGPDRRQRRRRVRPRPGGRLPRVVTDGGLPRQRVVPRLPRARHVRLPPVVAGDRPLAAAGREGAVRAGRGGLRQVERDAAHLHGVLREVLDPRPGQLVVAAYDTELFGHWWFEGIDWLEALLRRVHADDRLVTTTLRSRRERGPRRAGSLCRSRPGATRRATPAG